MFSMFKSWFCSHKWQVLSDTTTKSKMAEARDCGMAVTRGSSTSVLRRKNIQIVSCTKCGKLKRFVEVI